MRKLLLNPTPLFRKLRQLSMLLTLLLTLPQTAMGETVTKTITLNKSVSETNFPEGQNLATGSITLPVTITENGAPYDGQITIKSASINSYSSDANGAVFKMKGGNNADEFAVMISGNYPKIPSSATVKAAYTNCNNNNGYYFSIGIDETVDPGNTHNYNSTVGPNNNGPKGNGIEAEFTGDTNDGKPNTNRNYEGELYVYFYINAIMNPTNEADRTTVTIKEISFTYEREDYGLTIGNTVVKSDNRTDILGDGKVSYVHDATNNSGTLTLNGASITSTSTPAIDSSLGSLKVILVGENAITCGSNKAFNLAANSALNFTTNGTNSGQLTITSTSSITTESFYSPSNATVTYTGLVASNPNSTSVLISPPTSYDITVAGVDVTIDNASAITGNGISGNVSYDVTTNTLTLNGATINGGIVYSGAENLTIALKGTNSINNTTGLAINTQAATSASGTIKIIKASDASSAELTATGESDSSPIVSGTTLGTGLYWKPTAQNIMVITEDPEFIIIDDLIMTDNRTVSGDNSTGKITYSASNKTLTIDGFQKNFGANHAIKTGVSGLKVELIGASTINCSAESAVFHALNSSASIQFIKDDATSKLTMTGTAFSNFGAGKITYDGLFYYEGTEKYITQPSAPELAWAVNNDDSYTYATIKYATTERTGDGNTAVYNTANPVRKYSFDYTDPKLTDVTNAEYPSGGIKLNSPGILTAWVEVSGIKSAESKGVRFGVVTNCIETVFDGAENEIDFSIQPSSMATGFSLTLPSISYATYNSSTQKLNITGCYDGNLYLNLNKPTTLPTNFKNLADSIKVVCKIRPPKPTLSVGGGTYDEAQTVTIASNYQGATIKYYFGETEPQTPDQYTAAVGITETKKLTAWVEVNNVRSDTVQANYIIRKNAELSYSAETATAQIAESGTTFTAPTLRNSLGINNITYSSSNEQVATISNTGVVTILGAGTTTISAKATDETIYTPTPASYVLTVTRNIINPFSNVMEGQNFATYYNHNEDLALPEGLTAYIVTGVSGTTVTITATGYLPKDVPLLLEKTGELAESLEMNGYSGEAGNFSSNKLKYVSSEAGETASGDQYVLYMNEFVKATGTIPPGKCYLDLNGVAPTRGMYGIGVDGSTGIEGITPDRTNGEGEWYDLQGRRIQQPTKAGIYIVNGKKVIINKK